MRSGAKAMSDTRPRSTTRPTRTSPSMAASLTIRCNSIRSNATRNQTGRPVERRPAPPGARHEEEARRQESPSSRQSSQAAAGHATGHRQASRQAARRPDLGRRHNSVVSSALMPVAARCADLSQRSAGRPHLASPRTPPLHIAPPPAEAPRLCHAIRAAMAA